MDTALSTDLSRNLSATVVRLLLALTICLGCCSSLCAQESFDTPVVRQRMYAELEQENEALSRQLSLLKKVVRLVTPNVVHIEARKNTLNATTRRPLEEAGSGVLVEINERLYVLTNRHVIKDANLTSIRIELSDGRSINPSQVWSDRGTDIAVMSVPSENLIPARVGNSDKLEIGDFVMAVGSPFGLSHSVTFGIISAKGRRDLKLGDDEVRFQDFMQTDAAINPGNSGGPLLNLKGEVVGLNTAIASNSGGNEGIGFTIPINMVMVVAKQLIDRGVVVRAFLGVHLDSKFNAATANDLGLPRLMGAKVSAITPSSPAETAKLKIGDVILTYNSVRVEDDNHLVNLVSLTPVGRDVAVILWRSGRQQTIQVRVGTRSEFNK
ncbi:MAG: serine protease Do [Pirellulaceae bacterium]|jgi:serine protease Do